MRWIMPAIALAACGGKDTCIDGACPAPCERLQYTCEPKEISPLYVGLVGEAPLDYRLARGAGADRDTLISNGVVTAVIAAPDGGDLDLAPTGGNLIDYGPVGGADDVTIVYQLAGILPEDAFAYTSLERDLAADRVGVTLRGTLAGRPEVKVATRYEIRLCDPGIRVRTELFNGSPDTHAWVIADTSHHGKRRVLPFSPGVDRGYLAPELDLLELTALWDPYDYDAGATPSVDGPGYATVACNADQLHGVDDPEIAALGTEMQIVEPGETVVLERMMFTAGAGQGPRPAIDEAVKARAQLFGQQHVTVTGRIVAGGMPFGGDVRRASVIVRSNAIQASAVVPGVDGRFTAIVPAPDPAAGSGLISIEVHSFGVLQEFPILVPGVVDAGDIEVPLPATAQLSVTLGPTAGIHALVAFHPADDATRAAVTGTFHGRAGTCAPWLGPPDGASPACNRVLVDPRGTEIEVPAGKYLVVATAGPEHTLAKAEVELVAGEITPISFELRKLPLVPVGWLSADLHVHGRASFDSGFPDTDRVRSFAAAGVQVIAATDHDVIGDYTDTVLALGLDRQIAVLGGLEATQLIPWLDVPGEDLPKVIGHFNFFPLTRLPGEPRAGAPSDEGIEPGTLFDRMAPLVGDHGVMMLNHPFDEPLFGRDLGYLRAINFDPRIPLDRQAAGRALLRRPTGGHRNIDWNVIEVLNGSDPMELMKARVLWHSLLAQGFVVAGAGNSDSHSMSDQQLGWARNWVDCGINDVARFDADRFDAALRAGKVVAGNGVVVRVEYVSTAGGYQPTSLAPRVAGPGDRIAITVSAPPWVPVEEVRVVTSAGTRVLATASDLVHPVDPFGVAGVIRFRREVALADLISRDDFIIIEAGLRYPRAVDLDDDGVVDTSDNDGDGDVDADDVEPDEDVGPLAPPPDPLDETDPRFWMTRVVPLSFPAGFSNPVIVDLDGNGWTPPGLGAP
jgi:hypothetical protein